MFDHSTAVALLTRRLTIQGRCRVSRVPTASVVVRIRFYFFEIYISLIHSVHSAQSSHERDCSLLHLIFSSSVSSTTFQKSFRISNFWFHSTRLSIQHVFTKNLIGRSSSFYLCSVSNHFFLFRHEFFFFFFFLVNTKKNSFSFFLLLKNNDYEINGGGFSVSRLRNGDT
jgi:hypothetical protein